MPMFLAQCRLWNRHDANAKSYMTTKSGGPDWDKVVKRKTWTKDGQCLESVMIRDKPEDYDWHQKLDNPQDNHNVLVVHR